MADVRLRVQGRGTYGSIEAPTVVGDVMVRRPKVLPTSATLGEVRDLLADDHVHMVLLAQVVSGSRTRLDDGDTVLLGTLRRDDVPPDLPDDEPALPHARLSGRTVRPDAPVSQVHDRLVRSRGRRLAVVDADGRLRGLLCLKRHGRGFCADDGVRELAARRANQLVSSSPAIKPIRRKEVS